MSGELHNAKFFEQVEACRPGSSDLHEEFAPAAERIASDPAAKQYYDHVQSCDARLTMAFHDVAVPADLAVRLLAAVDAAARDAGTSAATEEPIATPASKAAPAAEKTPRRFPSLLVTIAAFVLVMVGALAVLTQFAPYSEQQCLTAATQLDQQLKAGRAGQWDAQLAAAPADRKPKTRLYGAFRGWQSIELLGDQQAVAYRFKNKNATLFVCQPSKSVVGAFPTTPPASPQQTASQSSGTHVATWTNAGLVHVLIVTGPIEDYRAIVGATRPVVAQFRPQSLPNRYDG